jgi:hypothetical protein
MAVFDESLFYPDLYKNVFQKYILFLKIWCKENYVFSVLLIHARDTSKDLIGKICFRLCKVDSGSLWLISKNFSPPPPPGLILVTTGYHHQWYVSKKIPGIIYNVACRFFPCLTHVYGRFLVTELKHKAAVLLMLFPHFNWFMVLQREILIQRSSYLLHV